MVIIPTEKHFEWSRAPVVLFVIVILNLLVFLLYQTGDQQKFVESATAYEAQELFEFEWPYFAEYLEQQNEDDTLQQFEALLEAEAYYEVYIGILARTDFYEYMLDNRHTLIAVEDAREWIDRRQPISDMINSVSSIRFGLIPNELNPFTFITYQFLHGDTMHLASNMFFLIVCGFAVEAAIGRWLFLSFYLVSGIVGGLLHALMDLSSTTSLVGASGSISGVMAMYLAVFRLKKIEFFYWVLVFVGYFRAPALVILPVFIGNELYQYFQHGDSNVAFMAHTGGFIAGGILIGAAYLLNKTTINQEYVEEDQAIDPVQEKLAKVYSNIEQFRFDSAAAKLQELIKEHGPVFEWRYLQYQLEKNKQGAEFDALAIGIINTKKTSKEELAKVETVWKEQQQLHTRLSTEEQISLAMRMATVRHINSAEGIFERLHNEGLKNAAMGILARKLAVVYDGLKDRNNKVKYDHIAEELLSGSV